MFIRISTLRLLFKTSALIVLFQSLCTGVASGEDKLIFAIDVIRHGDRTPLSDIPAAPHKWVEGFGQLTAIGIQQECELGSKLRTVYVNQYHLLPANYVSGTIYVRSTDSDRTLMSAQSVLTGLYPPGTGPLLLTGQPAAPCGFQPIPIHTIPKETDALLIPDYQLDNYNKLVERYVFSTPEWKKKSDELAPKFDKWSQATGVRITNLFQLRTLGDSIFIYQLHGLDLPAEIKTDAQTIIDAGRWVFLHAYQSVPICHVTGDAFLNEIAGYLKQASEKASPLKYVLYSAHDSTLLDEMTDLGAPLTEVPPYASVLKFSLFETDHNTFRVKVTYNDQPVKIPTFGGNSGSLADFIALAAHRP